MGPWVHGGWARGTGEMVGNVAYGPSPSLWYQDNIEAPFFKSYLKDDKPATPKLPEAYVFRERHQPLAHLRCLAAQAGAGADAVLSSPGGKFRLRANLLPRAAAGAFRPVY